MMFTMSQIANYHQKQMFMVNMLRINGIMAVCAIGMTYIFPQYRIFFEFLYIICLIIMSQSILFNTIGNYVGATAVINNEVLNELDIDINTGDKND